MPAPKTVSGAHPTSRFFARAASMTLRPSSRITPSGFLEKPLGVIREEGRKVIEAARAKKRLVGCAPDTVLGAGIQTARKVLDSGTIGRPVAFTSFMLSRGVETWH